MKYDDEEKGIIEAYNKGLLTVKTPDEQDLDAIRKMAERTLLKTAADDLTRKNIDKD
jgi:hypothetical protein